MVQSTAVALQGQAGGLGEWGQGRGREGVSASVDPVSKAVPDN